MNSFKEIAEAQKSYFESGETLDYSFRIGQLKKLLQATQEYEEKFIAALKQDLHKSTFEAWGVEVGLLEAEIKYFIQNLHKWMKPTKLSTPLFHFRAKSYIQKVPYGNTLIIAPWNYPILLTLRPLIGAIAAGNTAILKPSENAPQTAAVLEEMINTHFNKKYVFLINTDAEGTTQLLKQQFNFIFFTGGTKVGGIVYEAAAKHLTPVALELGGKNPCIIDESANLDITAARICMGAFSNCGQTCVTTDYLLVHENIKQALINKLKEKIIASYGSNAIESKDYGRIINTYHFDRIKKLLEGQNIIFGGNTNREEKYIEPTIIDNPPLDSAIMQEEVFGPILPIISYTHLDDAIKIINRNPNPLVLYLFSKNKSLAKRLAIGVSCGDMVINEVMLHFGNLRLPIGGVGASGIGKYQGKYSFDEFSHKKSVMHKYYFPELQVRYPPYNDSKFKLLKQLYRWIMQR